MADGGGINLRLSLKGAEQVRAELASIGPAGNRMARDLDRALRQPSGGMKALDTGMREARNGLDGFASRAGPVGSVLQSFGGWGMAAAAGFAAVAAAAAAAIQIANQATTAAADLTDAADRIGVGTEALQQWRYVADEAGVPVQALEADLEKLNGVLGKFKMGIGDAKLKPWFQELGISKSDLDSISTADQLMLMLADRLGQITDRSKQVAAARAFGIEASLPALRLGEQGVRDLLEASKELGVVLDAETVQKLDEADRKAELAGQQLKTLAHGAVEPLATAMANAGSYLANLSLEFSRIEARTPGWIQNFMALSRVMPGTGAIQQVGEYIVAQQIRARRGPRTLPTPGISAGQSGVDLDDPALRRQSHAVAAAATGGGYQMQGHDAKGGGGGGDSGAARRAAEAERKRREIERLYEQLDREVTSSRRDVTQERWSSDAPADRAQLAKSLAALDRKERDDKIEEMRKDLERRGALDERRQLLLRQIADMNAEADALADNRIIEEQTKAEKEARLQAEQAYSDIQAEILSLASASARTSDERRAIELSILEIAQRRQKADLEAAIEAEKEPAARARLIAALENLPTLHAAQTDRVTRDNAGPFAAWREAQMTGPQTQEWLQGEALDALDGMNKGLMDAWKNADGAGDALSRMGRAGIDALGQIRDALMKVAIQQMIIQPLTNALFGGGKSGGGGGFLSNLMSNIMGSVGLGGSGKTPIKAGKARGGLNPSRGLVPVGEYGIELMDMPAGARIYDTERTERILRDATSGAGRGGGGGVLQPTFNMPVTVVNNGSEKLQATTRQSADGIDVLLEPMVRKAVGKMGSDGSLAKSYQQTPRGKTR
ncbi:hypothetical protein A4249_01245 [Brevundimonas sp. GW460-12-10-14-LB2]|uniref:hypothetical protein n=1 Tax=Brevundimonas sp. GW460-12-10-14-LB2 TaxID=1827469 RepID=UPI0007BCC228|nr:hypothetical protein [Brevundimonas sp. GW460-12-10-14-LB2]ANC52424.1 hypothetical protein A4249_01245 [Brevundimonas sp. GW460-12-10-14-LB2]